MAEPGQITSDRLKPGLHTLRPSGVGNAGGCGQSRSAGFQPAVSPISNRQSVASAVALRQSRRPQVERTAIQQVGNPRYAGLFCRLYQTENPAAAASCANIFTVSRETWLNSAPTILI